MSGPFISLLTDFGSLTAPAVCHGVMLGIAPDARILDLTHAVRKYAVRDGAILLASSVAYLPVGVHVAVVDPGVGTARRPIGLRAARGDLLIGPDNGLLLPAADRLGGVLEARLLAEPSLFLAEVSSTFHARDIFSPVAAHLAAGTPFEAVGPRLDRLELTPMLLPGAVARRGGLDSAVLLIDSFGNCRLAGEKHDLEAVLGAFESGRRVAVTLPGRDGTTRRKELAWVATFGEVPPGEALLYEDADFAGLALAVNQGSAAERFGLTLDDPLRIEPA